MQKFEKIVKLFLIPKVVRKQTERSRVLFHLAHICIHELFLAC